MKQKTPRSKKGSKDTSRTRSSTGRSRSTTEVLSPEVLPALDSDQDSDKSRTHEKPLKKSATLEELEEIEEHDEDPNREDLEEPSESDLESTGVPKTQSIDSEFQLVPSHDPLKRYLEDLRNHPLLTPEEEFSLSLRLKEHGDIEAAKKLVSANLRLVVKIAFEYQTYYSNLLDLIQEGNIGLMKAVSKFDPTKGARLGYYASWWIRSYILKYLLDNFRLVKVGTTQAQKKLFYHLMREKEKLEAQGLLAGPKLLAERLNVREKDVVEMEQRLSGRGAEVPLDAPIDRGADKPTSHLDLLVDPHERADETLARDELIQLLQKELPEFQKLLNDKELRILQDRLLADEPKTLQEVADLYGLTRERARQIEAKVIQKLREFLKPYLGEEKPE
jgi:RNA polymerase sigma-32 factor